MKKQTIFKRVEQKYLITRVQQIILLNTLRNYMIEDEYGKSRVNSIYFDTPDNVLIRRSMQKPVYKEKLRIRSYGNTTSESEVFVELKKKYKSVVYKRRVAMSEKEARDYLLKGKAPSQKNQILNEIDYFIKTNKNLKAKMYISCEREAFFAKEDEDFRITFDKNILWRENNLSLCENSYGINLLKKDMVLMEVKAIGSIPLWMSKILTENQIYKTSFSKYANAYKMSKELDKMDNREIILKKAS